MKMKSFKFYLFCLVFFGQNQVYAGGGAQLGLSENYITGGIYSLSGFDGEDIQQDRQSGFVHSQLALHYDPTNESMLLDVFGEAGRFVLEDKSLSLAAGIRPFTGQTQKDEKYTLLEIGIGVRANLTSWISETSKLHTGAYYYHIPKVTSLGDFQGGSMFGARISFPVIASSEVYVAYDRLAENLKDSKDGGEVEIINAFSLGVRLGL